ncbi:hypothetical protein ACFSQP_02545 [Bizionia sediminis]|uniref:DUF4369 domain-containing protein n=1 Tax=Bizionia sediminis TaxID=1737064 RepID=A0ABW5KPC9_9FLAO
MIRRLGFFSILVLLSVTAVSQEAEWLSGTLFVTDGSVKSGMVKIPQPTKSIRIGANKIAFKLDENAKTERFKNSEIASVILNSEAHGSAKYVMVIVDKKPALLKEVDIIGNLTIYSRNMEINHAGAYGIWFSNNYNELFVKRTNEKAVFEILSATRGINYFKKQVAAYFSSCTAVVKAAGQVAKKADALPALQKYASCL